MTHVSKNTGNNEWYTPPKFIDSARVVMGDIDCDPASNEIAQLTVQAKTYYTKEHSGLDKHWEGRIWMNPPYSSNLIGQFCERLAMFRTIGIVTEFITLTNNATDTKWFSTLGTVINAVCLITGRVRFISPDGQLGATPLQGQIITYSGNKIFEFEREFSKYGKVMK